MEALLLDELEQLLSFLMEASPRVLSVSEVFAEFGELDLGSTSFGGGSAPIHCEFVEVVL